MHAISALFACLVAVAASCGSAAPAAAGEAPAQLARVVVARVDGPTHEGNAFPLSAMDWLTCRHVVPGGSIDYRIEGIAGAAAAVAGASSEAGKRVGDDWSLLRREHSSAVPVDFACPLDPGTVVWIVGWKRKAEPGAAPSGVYARQQLMARVVGGPDDGYWSLTGIEDGDHRGLSGAPVVRIAEDGALVVVGMYCGVVESRRSFLGIQGSVSRVSVFIRPVHATR